MVPASAGRVAVLLAHPSFQAVNRGLMSLGDVGKRPDVFAVLADGRQDSVCMFTLFFRALTLPDDLVGEQFDGLRERFVPINKLFNAFVNGKLFHFVQPGRAWHS